MTGAAKTQRTLGQRTALLLVACALLLRLLVPSGWMPVANGAGLSLNWCNESGIGRDVPAEAHALLAKALGDKPDPTRKTSGDQPCAFAAAAQPMAAAGQPLLAAPPAAPEPVRPAALATIPGRGLAAPPPLSTGPPHLA